MSFAFMPLYTGDYQRDTAHLDCAEHGVYLLLLMHCWDSKGPAPIDERKLLGISRARSGSEIEAMRRVLSEFFVRMDDGWYNKRMQLEVERAESLSRVRSDAGRRGYEAKAKHLQSTCLATASTPTPTLTPTPTTKKVKSTVDANAPAPRPSLDEVKTYCQQRGNSVDPQKWLDHYTANGWKVGKNAMKDWRAAVRTWERNELGGTAAVVSRAPRSCGVCGSTGSVVETQSGPLCIRHWQEA